MTLSPLVVALRFVGGVFGGVVATLVMDAVMARLPEGETPPRVAAGVLTRTAPGDAPDSLAGAVHYLAGALTGALFVWLALAAEGLLGGPSVVTTASAALVLYVLMVGFFVAVVLPRSAVDPGRVGRIRRDWALSAAAYLLVAVPLAAAAAAPLR